MIDDARAENLRLELVKSRAALRAARALGELGLWDDAVSRAYYAAHHAATAALYGIGIAARTHEGTHDLLFQHFVRSGELSREVAKDLSALRQYREQADYSTQVSFTVTDGAEEIDRAARVMTAIEAMLTRLGLMRA